jgi:hypothetical protein
VAKPDEMSIAKSVLLDVLRECNVTDPGTLEWASAQLEARVEKLMRDKLAAAEVSDCGKYDLRRVINNDCCDCCCRFGYGSLGTPTVGPLNTGTVVVQYCTNTFKYEYITYDIDYLRIIL